MNQVDEIYKNKRWQKKIHKNDESPVAPSLYGEITKEGVQCIIDEFKLFFEDKQCVFYDLGSGAGKMVLHVAVSCEIKKSIGIEYYEDRVLSAIAEVPKYNYMSAFPPEFHQADLFNFNYEDATVMYVDCTNRQLFEMVKDNFRKKIPNGCLFLYRGEKMWGDAGVVRGEFCSPTTYSKSRSLRWIMF
tara:strand:- start:445 stop:1008 length:564 start_codon:yes stop_codon:yes gene_type:complete